MGTLVDPALQQVAGDPLDCLLVTGRQALQRIGRLRRDRSCDVLGASRRWPGLGIGGEDLEPHACPGGRDPGHVAQSLAWISGRARSRRRLQPGRHRCCNDVRCVRHQRNPLIMLGRGHRDREGPAGQGQPRYQKNGLLVIDRLEAEHPRPHRRTGLPARPPAPIAHARRAGGRGHNSRGHSPARARRPAAVP